MLGRLGSTLGGGQTGNNPSWAVSPPPPPTTTNPSKAPAVASAAVRGLALLSDAPFWTSEIPPAELRAALEAPKADKPKLAAMKRIIALISQGADVSSLFPSVVKNASCPSLEIKKLVYFYLTHYSATNSDIALLSINSFQHDLSSGNERIRAGALRAMSSIRVPLVMHLLMRAVQQGHKDSSPYVRKAAALAIPKIKQIAVLAGSNSLDNVGGIAEVQRTLLDMLKLLVGDGSFIVFPAALAALRQITAPLDQSGENDEGVLVEIMHPFYRYYCRVLADLDPAYQEIVLNCLLIYARKSFANPFPNGDESSVDESFAVVGSGAGRTSIPSYANFFGDKPQEKEQPVSEPKQVDNSSVISLDPDHLILLEVCSNLLYSSSPSVVLASSLILFYAAPPGEFARRNAHQALLRTIRTCRSREMEYMLFQNISVMVNKRPKTFSSYIKSFFICPSDPSSIKSIKLGIICEIVKSATHSAAIVLQELRVYLVDGDSSFIVEVVKAISRIGSTVESAADTCITTLMQMIERQDFGSTILAEVVVAIRQLLKQHPKLHGEIIPKLIRFLEKTEVPQARASVVWIVAEYRVNMSKYAPDVLRKLAKTFPSEKEAVKFQILNLAVKLKLDADREKASNPNYPEKLWTSITLLNQYILHMCRYDVSIDVRDRTRLLEVAQNPPSDATTCLGFDINLALQEGILKLRPSPVVEKDYEMRRKSTLTLGSISEVLGAVIGSSYLALAQFPAEPPPSSIRDPPISSIPTASGVSSYKTITPIGTRNDGDDFYAVNNVKSGKTTQEVEDRWSSDEENRGPEDAGEEEAEEEAEEGVEEEQKAAEEDDDFGFGA